jgi:hypothetical protein
VGVWDLETARLVFTVQPPDQFVLSRTQLGKGVTRVGRAEFEFRDGRLSVRRSSTAYTFDGTPLKP